MCYDDEGSLECCCELRDGLDYTQALLLAQWTPDDVRAMLTSDE